MPPSGRTPPPEDNFEEAGFLKALGEKQNPSVKLMDGQSSRDGSSTKIRTWCTDARGAPNLFTSSKIMYIAEGGKREVDAPVEGLS
jgi:hypothetical protein